MKVIISNLTVGLIILAMTTPIFAQDEVEAVSTEETPAFTLSGSVDAYFRTNLGGDFDSAPVSSFANLPGFSLGMFNLIAAHEGEKVGFTADLVFGPRGADAVFASPLYEALKGGVGGSSQIVNQLYAYLNVSDNVTLTLGNFNTFLGYEVISPTGNFNYSTSYAFSYGPFSHTGLKADFSFDGGLSLMLGIFNPTDITEFNLTNDYTLGAQLGYEFANGGAWLNFIYDGANDFTQIDLTAGWDLTDALYFGVNATTASDSFSGATAYLQIATSDNFKIGGRVEYFNDITGGILGIPDGIEGGNVLDFTVSANYTVGNLTIIPEFRIDAASDDVFLDGTDLSSSLTSFVLAAVYGF
jgi:hypothetical protein